MRRAIFALSIVLSLFAWNSAAASTLLAQPIQNQQALLYYGGLTNQVNFDQGAVLGTITTLRLWLQSTTTRSVYLGWQSADGNAGNYATATVSGGNIWQWVDFDLTWNSSYNAPIATSTRTFVATSSLFLYYIPYYQGAPDVLAGCMQATSSLVISMGGFYAPECGTPTFELLGVSTTSPLATTSVPCVTECNSNVLFLPGIKGSRLYRPDYSGGTDQLWEPTSDVDIVDLHLSALDGSSVRDDVYVKQHDILDAAFGIAPAYYGAFINDMDAMKSHQIINDWEAVPYDWRLSIDKIVNNGAEINGRIYYDGALSATTSPYIIQEIRRLAANSKTGKVMIIAHSNGGLVTKALIKKLQDEHDPILEKIDKIIFVAVPQLGTPHSLGVLLHGYNEGLPSFIPEWAPDALHVLLTEHAARTFAENAPVAYNLLPSLKYFQDVSDPRFPVVRFDSTTLYQQERLRYGNAIDNASEMNDFLLARDGGRTKPDELNLDTANVLNSNLITLGASTHSTLDNWTPPSSLQLYEIAGWGNDTLAGINYYDIPKTQCVIPMPTSCAQFGQVPTATHKPILTEDGDGVVVTPSGLAILEDENTKRYWLNLSETDQEHGDILENSDLRGFIASIINDNIETLSGHGVITATRPTSINIQKRLHYFLHSPLALSVTDSTGRISGYSTTTKQIESQIPRVSYGELGDVKYISVPAELSLQLHLDGYATGTFALDIEEVTGGVVVATTTFADIPTSTSTAVTMDIHGSIASSSSLRVDENGDGVIDFSFTPVVGNTFLFPLPKSSLTITANNKTITLGSAIPPLTATLSGFQSGDTATSSTSGAASCTTTATTTSTVGTYSITCTKGTLNSSKYDFTKFATGTLTILYRFDGFLQPINDTAYNPTQTLSVFKGGSTVPVKFQLKAVMGTPVQSKVLPLWLTPQKGALMSVAVDESTYSDPATSGTSFKWDAASQQYLYNWSTKGLLTGYWYKLSAQVDDGTVQSVVVGVR